MDIRITVSPEADPGAEALKEIIAGLDGVTEGPWKVYNGCSWSRIGRVGGRDTAVVYSYINPSDGHPEMGSSEGYHVRNFDHIARCDPDTMRSIAAYAAKLEARSMLLAQAIVKMQCSVSTLPNGHSLELPCGLLAEVNDAVGINKGYDGGPLPTPQEPRD